MTEQWGSAGEQAVSETTASPLDRNLHYHLPMLSSDEVADLAARYGAPDTRTYYIPADDYIYSYRRQGLSDRRAEVVFAIQDQSGRVWVHTKHHYPPELYRLPTGGIHKDELVEEALLREVDEETGLAVEITRFVAVLEYEFWRGASMMPFVSYVFHVTSRGGAPACRRAEEIAGFRAVSLPELAKIGVMLRNLTGDRHAWGQWRAPAHDIIYHSLTN